MNKQETVTRLLASVCLALFGMGASSSHAQDPTTTLMFDFSNFTEISVTTVFNVTAIQDSDFSVEVTIDEDEADRVSVTQTGTTLNISLLEAQGNANIETLEAVVTLPVLDRVDLDGVVFMNLKDFNQAQLTADVGGVSRLRGDSLMISNLTATVAGTSGLNFVNVLPIASTNLDISGVSEAILNMGVGASLSGSVTGISNISYFGTNVAVDVTIGTGSSVTRLGDTLTDGFRINPGLNGAWFNSDTPGQGFLIEVFPDIPLLFLAWFTWDTTQAAPANNQSPLNAPADSGGKPMAVVGDDNHRWLTAQGGFGGNAATLDVVLTTGGLFDDPAPVSNSPPGSYGTITISFEDCTSGQVVYNLTSPELSGTIPISRLANDNVPLCEQLSGGGFLATRARAAR